MHVFIEETDEIFKFITLKLARFDETLMFFSD